MKNFSTKILTSSFALSFLFAGLAHADAGTKKAVKEAKAEIFAVQHVDDVPTVYEAGLTLGTPVIVNVVFGYWTGTESQIPWMTRVSGMYYGGSRGVQLDLGYQFYRHEHFRQYVGVGAMSLHHDTAGDYSNETLWGTGVGPMYGFHLWGAALDVGMLFGHFEEDYNNAGFARNSTDWSHVAAFTLQLGYTWMW